MNELEETVTTLKTLFDKVDELQKINIRDMLKLELYTRTESLGFDGCHTHRCK